MKFNLLKPVISSSDYVHDDITILSSGRKCSCDTTFLTRLVLKFNFKKLIPRLFRFLGKLHRENILE